MDPVGANATIVQVSGSGVRADDDRGGGAGPVKWAGARPAVVRQKTRLVTGEGGGGGPAGAGLIDVLEVVIPGEIAEVEVNDKITVDYDGDSFVREVWTVSPQLFDRQRVTWMLVCAPVSPNP